MVRGQESCSSKLYTLVMSFSCLSVPGVTPTPPQVRIAPSSLPGAPLGVFSNAWVKEGTEMGPFVGRIVLPQQVDFTKRNDHMWEVSQVFNLSQGLPPLLPSC